MKRRLLLLLLAIGLILLALAGSTLQRLQWALAGGPFRATAGAASPA